MKSKFVLLAGVAAGYVLGTRAGRGQYEKIRAQAKSMWNDPKVQDQVSTVAATVKDQAPVVQEKIIDVTRKAVAKAGGGRDAHLENSGSGI